jgi:hypothetical protein
MKITLSVAFLPCAVAPGALRGVLYEAAEAARSLMDITGGSDAMRSTNKGMGRPTSAPTMRKVQLYSFEIVTARLEYVFLTSLLSYYWSFQGGMGNDAPPDYIGKGFPTRIVCCT